MLSADALRAWSWILEDRDVFINNAEKVWEKLFKRRILE